MRQTKPFVAALAFIAAAAVAAEAGADHRDHRADASVAAGHDHMRKTDAADMAAFSFADGDLDRLNAELTERFGIEFVGARLTAHDMMIDFRYHVVDAERAASLHGQHIKPILIHEPSGQEFKVPFAAKIGSLRQSAKPPIDGRTYVILFANPGHMAKHGDPVTVEQAGLKISGIKVE